MFPGVAQLIGLDVRLGWVSSFVKVPLGNGSDSGETGTHVFGELAKLLLFARGRRFGNR